MLHIFHGSSPRGGKLGQHENQEKELICDPRKELKLQPRLRIGAEFMPKDRLKRMCNAIDTQEGAALGLSFGVSFSS